MEFREVYKARLVYDQHYARLLISYPLLALSEWSNGLGHPSRLAFFVHYNYFLRTMMQPIVANLSQWHRSTSLERTTLFPTDC